MRRTSRDRRGGWLPPARTCVRILVRAETDAPVAAVAERLVARGAAAAERDARVFSDHGPVVAEDAQAATQEEGPVRARLDRRFLGHLFLRPAVEPPEVECPGRTRSHRLRDLVRVRRVHRDPRPGIGVEHLRQCANAVLHVDAQARLPRDLDSLAGVRAGRTALLFRGRAQRAVSGWRSMYARTNGHTATGRSPEARMSSSAPATSCPPSPWPSNFGATSVWTRTTASERRR